jgi:hypothetical protein
MDDDTLLRERVRPKSTLLEMKPLAARPPAPEAPEETETESSALDDIASLPQPGSAYEAAYARPSNKPVPTLRFVVGDAIRGLPYANYDSIDWLTPDNPGASPAIVIRFTGLVPREAVIAGRDLLRLYDLLSHHRVAWVREMPKGKGFMNKGGTVITSITIRPITEVPA